MSEIKPVVSILMGSRSDLPTMENCFNQLKEFGIPFEAHALSAHRTPNEVIKLAEGAKAELLIWVELSHPAQHCR